MIHSRPKNSAASSHVSINSSDSGVVISTGGGFSRWRLRFAGGVSPVRVSALIGSSLAIGLARLRSISTASAFSGEIYSVCSPLFLGFAARSTRLGRNPARVLPVPVGATSSDDFRSSRPDHVGLMATPASRADQTSAGQAAKHHGT